jgi:hypothetical protein
MISARGIPVGPANQTAFTVIVDLEGLGAKPIALFETGRSCRRSTSKTGQF